MGFVRSVKYLIKCNNILSETIIPERGLHQGDPLSPYFLLFCMEAFSRMLTQAQNNNVLKCIPASRNELSGLERIEENIGRCSLERICVNLKGWGLLVFGQVGNVDCINIWVDNWGMEDLNGRTMNSNMSNSEANSVRDLWMENERNWDIDKVHSICEATNETLLHALRDCPTSREVLPLGGWDMSIITNQYDCYVDWLENMTRIMDKRAMVNLFTTLWNFWNNRNNFIFKGKEDRRRRFHKRKNVGLGGGMYCV
ncbi:hypothetical protein J1N35_037128 [Gossypium stocksii]|uniref:Reverse transcriptase domain-containing protein n=1 Tax=Gossypium stocksii TaxID=47602 RepID=A0A9D3UK62_9ROSI|nr:hypothetical protein J1N35_037128 [Gossypium stocksii]